jgi:hypothetical protein
MIELSKDLEDDLRDYLSLLNYARFISVQDKHFELHSSIDDIQILFPKKTKEGDNAVHKLEIHYLSSFTKDDLNNSDKGIRVYSEKNGKSIADHIIGDPKKNDRGYVLKEFESLSDYLNKYFEISRVGIWGPDCLEDKVLKLVKGVEQKSGKYVDWKSDVTWFDYIEKEK